MCCCCAEGLTCFAACFASDSRQVRAQLGVPSPRLSRAEFSDAVPHQRLHAGARPAVRNCSQCQGRGGGGEVTVTLKALGIESCHLSLAVAVADEVAQHAIGREGVVTPAWYVELVDGGSEHVVISPEDRVVPSQLTDVLCGEVSRGRVHVSACECICL